MAEVERMPPTLKRNRSGKFHLPEAVKRTRFDLAARLLMAHARQEDMAAALGITDRQVRRLLRDPEFNAYADLYRKALLGAVDKAIHGRFLEMLPTATEVYWKAMRDYIGGRGGGEIARKAALDVFARAGIKPPKAEEGASPLAPAQEEAMANVTRRWMELHGMTPAPLALPPSTEGSDDTGRGGEGAGPAPPVGS